MTFTNKAAIEMKNRVESILKHPVEGMFIGTFHSICLRFLRKHAEFVGLKSDFTILDKDDQLRLVKQVISLKDLDTFSKNIKGKLKFEYSLKNHTWLNIGGKAKIFFVPETLSELREFLLYAKKETKNVKIIY